MTADIPRDNVPLVRAATEAQATLREAAAAATEAAARARSLAALLDEALAALTDLETAPAQMPRPAPAFPSGAASLSPREQEVLALVAVGRSNKAIAEALFVSPNTVKTHVASLLNKLHADSRVQLAAIATQQSLYQHHFAAFGA